MIYIIKHPHTPTITTSNFNILLATFSDVFLSIIFEMKSVYNVPATQLRLADNVLEAKVFSEEHLLNNTYLKEFVVYTWAVYRITTIIEQD